MPYSTNVRSEGKGEKGNFTDRKVNKTCAPRWWKCSTCVVSQVLCTARSWRTETFKSWQGSWILSLSNAEVLASPKLFESTEPCEPLVSSWSWSICVVACLSELDDYDGPRSTYKSGITWSWGWKGWHRRLPDEVLHLITPVAAILVFEPRRLCILISSGRRRKKRITNIPRSDLQEESE